jgi:hypothetical protein
MPLRARAFCQYLTHSPGLQWRTADHAANKFVHAIKGDPLVKYAWIPVLGRKRKLEQENASDAATWFAAWAAAMIPKFTGTPDVMLVPVPSSNTILGSQTPSRAANLAQLIVSKMPKAKMLDVIRWRRAMTPAHNRGPRFADQLYPQMRVEPPTPRFKRDATHVLVDDVVTSGGHVRACAALLVAHGVESVDYAVAAGRTFDEALDDPFAVPDAEYAVYEP